MVHKIFAITAMMLLGSTWVSAPLYAANEFSPYFTNRAPAAFGDEMVNPQDLIAQQEADDAVADQLNAIMPAAGDVANDGMNDVAKDGAVDDTGDNTDAIEEAPLSVPINTVP
ncbi:MAG TPA: hypothetical protein VGD95_06230 [Micavibrio sp.]